MPDDPHEIASPVRSAALALGSSYGLSALVHPGLGWKYGVQPGKNDTSVTGWAVLALEAARHARLEVPDAAFDGALAWFERATAEGGRGRAPGLVGYERPGDGGSMIARDALDHPEVYPSFQGPPTMTAVALLGRVFAGEARERPRVREGVKSGPSGWRGGGNPRPQAGVSGGGARSAGGRGRVR